MCPSFLLSCLACTVPLLLNPSPVLLISCCLCSLSCHPTLFLGPSRFSPPNPPFLSLRLSIPAPPHWSCPTLLPSRFPRVPEFPHFCFGILFLLLHVRVCSKRRGPVSRGSECEPSSTLRCLQTTSSVSLSCSITGCTKSKLRCLSSGGRSVARRR